MFTCSMCKFYHQIDDSSGECFGVEVPGNREARACPKRAFQMKDRWLKNVDPYEGMIKNLYEYVRNLHSDTPPADFFTPHGTSHSENVLRMIKVIVTKTGTGLSGLEKFLLTCAAWTHDLGMRDEIARAYLEDIYGEGFAGNLTEEKRKHHHNISSWHLMRKVDELFNGPEKKASSANVHFHPALARTVSTLIRYHRREEDIMGCAVQTSIRGEVVRLRLLAAIFRLADALHKDSSRFDPSIYATMQIAGYDRRSRLHWLKSFLGGCRITLYNSIGVRYERFS